MILANGEILQIFGIVIAIGKSDHYSISFEYDSEFGWVELRLWYSVSVDDFYLKECIYSRYHTFAELISKLKEWTTIVVNDRKVDD